MIQSSTSLHASGEESRALRTWLHRVLLLILVVACVNVLYLLGHDAYDFHLGPLHLFSHGFFKPTLIFYTAFVLTILVKPPNRTLASRVAFTSRQLAVILAAIGVVWFFATSDINPIYDEWNYRGFSRDLHGRVWTLFVTPQFSAWYRPLGFLSEWLDSLIFAGHLWGYHIQNIAWHLLNAYLAGVLAMRLGLCRYIAGWATILFACAAVTYEPVMWPSARFDLLAMAFTAIALITAIDYLEQGTPWKLFISTFSYALAVISKESGYSLPVLLIPIVFLVQPNWRTNTRRIVTLAAVLFGSSAVLLAIRFAVVRGIGGYPEHAGVGSPHLSFTITTLQSLVTKLFPVTLMASNQMYPMPGSVRIVLGCFALLLVASAFAGASVSARGRWFAVLALLSTGPVVTLVSWLDPAAQHVRYVYMPAVFVMVLVAVALSNARRSSIFLALFAGLSLSVGTYNAEAYRATYQRAEELAQFILSDYKHPSATDEIPPQTHEFRVINMPGEFNGVLFSQFELMYRFQIDSTLVPYAGPTTPLNFIQTADLESQACRQNYCYLWQPDTRRLLRLH